jgi:hypothetical protein
MRTPIVLFAALLLLNATIASGQSVRTKPSSGSESDSDSPRGAPVLAGTWRSAEERVPLNSPFDVSVWGKGASSVRVVNMTVKASGEATVTVTRKVADARNRTVPGSTAIERADVVVGESREGLAGQHEYDLKVVKAERRYPDMPGSEWSIDGLKVKLSVSGSAPQSLEIRFDTPEGNGSFWETLRRAAAAAPKRATP